MVWTFSRPRFIFVFTLDASSFAHEGITNWLAMYHILISSLILFFSPVGNVIDMSYIEESVSRHSLQVTLIEAFILCEGLFR